jgi:Flp pilus assembly protein TadD
MNPRARVWAVVALAAAAAVAAVVGTTLLQTHGERTAPASRKGAPALELDFGVRADSEARALARAASLYRQGQRSEAGRIFGRYRSLEAQIGAALAAWPHGSLDALKRLVASHPESSLAELHLGLAYYWSGRDADAVAAWRQAAALQPDTPAAVAAQDWLHPQMFPGLPYIVAPLSPPPEVANLPAAQEVAALARAAEQPDAQAKLLYGLALWNTLRRPVSAERQFVAAARLSPHDPTVLTAAAVGAFTKSDPVKAFSRLGPLTGVFPHSTVVRFHLGLLLIWTHSVRMGEQQLKLAIVDNPRSLYAQQARTLLSAIQNGGTK